MLHLKTICVYVRIKPHKVEKQINYKSSAYLYYIDYIDNRYYYR